MTILRIGSNANYAEGWDRAFGRKSKSAKPAAGKTTTAKASSDKKKAAPKKKKKAAKK